MFDNLFIFNFVIRISTRNQYHKRLRTQDTVYRAIRDLVVLGFVGCIGFIGFNCFNRSDGPILNELN